MDGGKEAGGVDLEPLAARITTEVMARVGRSWRWRLAALAAVAGEAVVLADALVHLWPR